MSEKIDVKTLGDLPETLLMTLYARALEAQHPDHILSDQMAQQIVDKIDYDFGAISLKSVAHIGVMLRAMLIDQAAQSHVDIDPTATIVNLGVGLGTRFFRLSKHQMHWYELDLPEAIALRHKLIPIEQAERYHYIAKSVLDYSWMDEIEAQSRLLFIAEGLFIYLQEEQIKDLLITLADRFPGSYILFDTVGPIIKRSKQMSYNPITRMNASLQWSMIRHKRIEDWDPRLRVDQVWNTQDFRRDRWQAAIAEAAGPIIAKLPMPLIRSLFSLYVVQVRLS